jgi:succinate dehydrogenase/fumarate reductase cytochrome b subunit
MIAIKAKPRFRLFHRASALLLVTFLVIHMVNHVVGLSGQAAHIAFMNSIRPIYRQPVIETVLLALFAMQVATGAILAIKGWRERHGFVAWAQALSGLYIAAFLLIHVSSVVLGRVSLDLDTDFRFASAGFHVAGWPWYFMPYYFLAVFVLFVHVGCALYWNLGAGSRRSGRIALVTLAGLGAVLGVTFVASMAGLLHPVVIPQEYLATYQSK